LAILRCNRFWADNLDHSNPIALAYKIKFARQVQGIFCKKVLAVASQIYGVTEKAPNTPLRPHILAAFLPWGGFAGAGRPARVQRYCFVNDILCCLK